MFQPILYAVIAVLSIICLLLAFKLYTSKKDSSLTAKTTLFSEEEIFNALALPTAYRKNNQWYFNKAFSHAFGTFSKNIFQLLPTLPRTSEQMLELTFDNDVKKMALIYPSYFFNDDNNEVQIYTIIDISNQHKSKALLMTQKERLELALEGSDEALWDWDIKNNSIFYSQKWKQIMGYAINENTSTLAAWLNLVHPSDIARVNEKIKAHIDGKTPLLMIEHRIRQSDPLKWVNIRAKAIRGKNDQAIRIVGSIRDITKRKADEVQEQIEYERFVAFVANLPALAFIKNSKGVFLYMNHAYEKFIGFQTWRNKTADNIFDKKTAENLLEVDRLSLYEGKMAHEVIIPSAEGLPNQFNRYTFIINEGDEKLLCGLNINKSFKV